LGTDLYAEPVTIADFAIDNVQLLDHWNLDSLLLEPPQALDAYFQASATTGLRSKNLTRTGLGTLFSGQAKFMHFEHR
jgi:hypothetical protein